MSHEIDCPVCNHPNIRGDVCPNCETDLSLIRSLIELPTVTVNNSNVNLTSEKRITRWFLISLILILFFLVVSVELGVKLPWNFLSMNRGSTLEVSQSYDFASDFEGSSSIEGIEGKSSEDPNSPGCNGFSYSVQPGDSLTGISQKFYGNPNYKLIVVSNPSITYRKNKLEIGETLCIVNP